MLLLRKKKLENGIADARTSMTSSAAYKYSSSAACACAGTKNSHTTSSGDDDDADDAERATRDETNGGQLKKRAPTRSADEEKGAV